MHHYHSALKTVTPPTSEPVTVAQGVKHCIDVPSDDFDYIADCISEAREFAERWQDRALLTQTLRYSLDCFPTGGHYTQNPMFPLFSGEPIRLPRPPLQAVTQITYLDSDANTVTLGETDIANMFVTYTDHEPGLLFPKWGTVWPVALPQPGSVTITFKAGHTDASLVPFSTKKAILLLVNYLYEERYPNAEAKFNDIAEGITALLDEGVWGSYA